MKTNRFLSNRAPLHFGDDLLSKQIANSIFSMFGAGGEQQVYHKIGNVLAPFDLVLIGFRFCLLKQFKLWSKFRLTHSKIVWSIWILIHSRVTTTSCNYIQMIRTIDDCDWRSLDVLLTGLFSQPPLKSQIIFIFLLFFFFFGSCMNCIVICIWNTPFCCGSFQLMFQTELN